MVAVESPVADIPERQSWAQICAQYPNEWVCVVDIEYSFPDRAEIAHARVVGHGVSKRAPVEQAKAWWGRYAVIGHFYTGTLRAPVSRFDVI